MKAPEQWHLGIFEGADAADFLHRLSTADVRQLSPGAAAVPAAFLNAQGRIQAAFWLMRETPTRFLVASSELGAVAEFIERYTFAEKQTFETLKLPPALWIWTDSADLPAQAQAASHCMHLGAGTWGKNWFSLWGVAPDPQTATLGAETFAARRVQLGVPWWGHEITPETSPLEIHFQAAVAEGKGCYPGQEVIERTLALGAPARRLCRISLPPSGIAPEGWTVTTRAPEGESVLQALALLRKTQATVGAESGGATCLEVFDYKN